MMSGKQASHADLISVNVVITEVLLGLKKSVFTKRILVFWNSKFKILSFEIKKEKLRTSLLGLEVGCSYYISVLINLCFFPCIMC